MSKRHYGLMQAAIGQSDLPSLASYFLALMLRNMASDGFVFADPTDPSRFSLPGCVIASPSFDRNLTSVTQDYVFNWVRDAAVVATEIALTAEPVVAPGAGSGPLNDYAAFATTCQASTPTLARACFRIDGQPRAWTDQNDGPALQSLAMLRGLDQMDDAAKDAARSVIQRNLDFLIGQYQNPSYNLWEETYGQSFFTRSVQLRCFVELSAAGLTGVTMPAGTDAAIAWLGQALQQHWNGDHYVSVLDPVGPRDRYDPNIDIVLASVYGAVSCTDPRLLATAAKIRAQWADPASPDAYLINAADAGRGIGPLLGRYPGDIYDGDNDTSGTDHPWALCTSGFAQLYYLVAASVASASTAPVTALTQEFFSQVGVGQGTTGAQAADLLKAAGDRMLHAIVYHSDHLELSEQFDGATGFEKSVRNLTWSYASFLSAVRARTAMPG